jgi:ferritin
MTKVVLEALNDQIKNEIYSSYLYLSMSTHCEAVNLPGFAHWLRLQAQEELTHALKIVKYVEDRGGRVILQVIDQPPAEFASPAALFKDILAHEKHISSLIHKLYALAIKENDYPTQVMLQWFVQEQVEEEKTASEIVEQLKIVGDQSVPLLMLDRQLAGRAGSAGGEE